MSQLLQSVLRNGANFDAVSPIDRVDQGIPLTAFGNIAYEQLGTITHWWQGLPFPADGKIAGATEGTVIRIAPGGAPLNAATGHLVFSAGARTHVAASIPYTAANKIKIIP